MRHTALQANYQCALALQLLRKEREHLFYAFHPDTIDFTALAADASQGWTKALPLQDGRSKEFGDAKEAAKFDLGLTAHAAELSFTGPMSERATQRALKNLTLADFKISDCLAQVHAMWQVCVVYLLFLFIYVLCVNCLICAGIASRLPSATG